MKLSSFKRGLRLFSEAPRGSRIQLLLAKWFMAVVLSVFCLPSVAVTTPSVLRVGVVLGAPFAFHFGDEYQGLTLQLWQRIATDNHWAFRYVPTDPDLERSLAQLQAGQIDVLVGPISVNQQRLAKVDFSRPYFINNIGVVTAKKRHRLLDVFSDFIPQTFFAILVCLLLSFLLYVHLLWLFERGRHPEVHVKYQHAMREGFWVHLLKGGFATMPHTFRGKLTLLVWLFWAYLMVSIFNASVAAAFTVALAKQSSGLSNLSDLRQIRLIGVAAAAATEMAQEQGLLVQTVKTFPEAMARLEAGKVDAVVYDSVLAQDYLNENQLTGFTLNDFTISQEEYAFALPYSSPLTRSINMSITQLQDDGLMGVFCQKYLGDMAKYCQL